MGKSAGSTDNGGSAPCSKTGLAHVMKGGILSAYSWCTYLLSPCRGQTPSFGTGKPMIPAHSPSIAQAWVQSSGVLAVAPRSGVRANPPWRASVGSCGTNVVSKKLARLCAKKATHSSAVRWIAGGSIRLLLYARSVLACGLSSGGVRLLCSSLFGSMSMSSGKVGAWLVTMMRPALNSARASVMSRIAGGLDREVAIV